MELTEEQWMQMCQRLWDAYGSKSAEYGDSDLKLMGQSMSNISGSSEATGIEMALEFYLLGKIARAMSAHERHEPASFDTIWDIATYGLMLLAFRESWEQRTSYGVPGGVEEVRANTAEMRPSSTGVY